MKLYALRIRQYASSGPSASSDIEGFKESSGRMTRSRGQKSEKGNQRYEMVKPKGKAQEESSLVVKWSGGPAKEHSGHLRLEVVEQDLDPLDLVFGHPTGHTLRRA